MQLILTVPRDEFYNAALHFKGEKAADTLYSLEQIAIGKTNTLRLNILGKNLQDYNQAMFKEGRWTTNPNANHTAREVHFEEWKQ